MIMATGRGFARGGPLSIDDAEATFADDSAHEESSRGVFVVNRLDVRENLSLTTAVRVDRHSVMADTTWTQVRLQSVSLSWTVPQDMAGTFGLQRTTVTLSGYNLHWWDDCNCQDPSAKHHAADTGYWSGATFLALPRPRRFLLSVGTRF